MKISKIELENVKCFSKEILSLTKEETEEPLSMCALVGANGAGKSTILKSIVAAFSVVENEYKGEIFTDEAIAHGRDSLKINLNLKFNKNEKDILQFNNNNFEITYSHLLDEYENKKDVLFMPEDASDEEIDQFINVLETLFWNEQVGLIMYYDPLKY